MKGISRALFALLCAGSTLIGVEAKTIDCLFEGTLQENFCFTKEEQSTFPLVYQRLTIENKGPLPLPSCLPQTDSLGYLTLEKLASHLAAADYPLLSLYHLWKNSLVLTETASEALPKHPLDLLNFRGSCSKQQAAAHFAQLCQALGIEIRPTNIQGASLYDYCFQDEEWHLFEPLTQQLYLALDNQTLVSSEEIMDDPFLALRTKTNRQTPYIDFKQAWQQVARFNILHATSALPLERVLRSDDKRSMGFLLYPQDLLVFNRAEEEGKPCIVQHTLQLEARTPQTNWIYYSPFPVEKIINQSQTSLRLVEEQIDLQPGEEYVFTNKECFHLTLAFGEIPTGQLVLTSTCAARLFPQPSAEHPSLSLGATENPTSLHLSYTLLDEPKQAVDSVLRVLNTNACFDYCAPTFYIENRADENVEKIWWQIAKDDQFEFVPPNFEQTAAFNDTLTLPLISETFFNADETYYFRVKAFVKGEWKEWSPSYAFSVNKPAPVQEVEFNKIDEECYELNWERFAEEEANIEYLVYGSNALDFIPSLYCDRQMNGWIENTLIDEEFTDNLVAVTKRPHLRVNGHLAYYRIVVKQRGQYSVPSPLIHLYDSDLIQPRNVLQLVEEGEEMVLKRTLFPPSYPWTQTSLPEVNPPLCYENSLIKLEMLLRTKKLVHAQPYQVNRYVPPDIWEIVRPYFLPENHPVKPKLDRLFSQRVTLDSRSVKKAGFNRYSPGRWSRVTASSHPEIKDYFIKAYTDTELYIKNDWRKWIHRIEGARGIRACIKRHGYQSMYKVPEKWIYPLPEHPSPPNNEHYLRKNFILVAQNMRIESHGQNEKMYRKKMDPKRLRALYVLFQEEGLYDSVYIFNVPFCKDGKQAFIDTEFHHKWPVPFAKMTRHFSKDMQKLWEGMTRDGGDIPQPEPTRPHPPRQDR